MDPMYLTVQSGISAVGRRIAGARTGSV